MIGLLQNICVTLIVLPLFVACSKTEQAKNEHTIDTASVPSSITIMTFNVENLFDNEDDPGKDDKAYLPIEAKQSESHITECNTIEVESWRDDCLYLDWNAETIEHKLSVVADTIKQVGHGRGADIIALQEVENAAILDRLRQEHLQELNYLPPILIEGTDTRGIDVAFLSRLPLVDDARLHPIKFPDYPDREGDTRGLLEASFELPGGAVLTGFSVHFPAPFHPTEMRVTAYERLAELRNALPADHFVFAAGDFNTTSAEVAQTDILERFARPYWTIAHEVGCSGCRGTHYYARDDTWSFLDMIFWSPPRGENTTWRIRAESVRIANQTSAQVGRDGSPLRYNAERRLGVSDHFPLVVNLESTQKQ